MIEKDLDISSIKKDFDATVQFLSNKEGAKKYKKYKEKNKRINNSSLRKLNDPVAPSRLNER